MVPSPKLGSEVYDRITTDSKKINILVLICMLIQLNKLNKLVVMGCHETPHRPQVYHFAWTTVYHGGSAVKVWR